MRRKVSVALAAGLLVAAAGAADRPAGSDREKLQGTWVLVSAQLGVLRFGEPDVQHIKLVFAGDKLTVHEADRRTEHTFKLAPDKKPKEIDLATANGEARRAIYQLDGDTLKIACGDGDGAPRPREFPRKEAAGLIVATLKRQKP